MYTKKIPFTAFYIKDHGRYILVTGIRDVETTVKWNNEIQHFAEDQAFGIPVNFSSDPRHGAGADAEYKEHGSTSRWPDGLAIAALFSPETICSIPYRQYRNRFKRIYVFPHQAESGSLLLYLE